MHTPRNVHQVVLYFSAAVSLLGNGLLILVILHPRNRVLGSYRVLLVAFACVDITVSVVHAYVKPVYYTIEYGLAVFMLDTFSLPSDLSFIVNVVSICLLYISFPLLTCHFIYRYLALTRPTLIKMHFPQAVLAAILINVVVCSIICSGFWICELNNVDHFFDSRLLIDYGIDMRLPNAPRMIQLNYLHSPDGDWNWNSMRAMGTTCSVLAVTIIVNLSCATRIIKILENLEKTLSEKSKLLQQQLFRALIVQFSVPFLFCTVPFSFVVFSPITGHDFGQAANLVGMFISIYPAIDPYLVLFSMPQFLKIIMEWCVKHASSSSTVTPQAFRLPDL